MLLRSHGNVNLFLSTAFNNNTTIGIFILQVHYKYKYINSLNIFPAPKSVAYIAI